ncbi:MAG: ATP synthase subunit I [Alphaproteobacteria bacterium]
MTGHVLLDVALFAVLGAASGSLFFLSLARTLALYVEGRRVWRAASLHALRFALAGGVFWVIAQAGALPLVSALAGFLAARQIIVARARRVPC